MNATVVDLRGTCDFCGRTRPARELKMDRDLPGKRFCKTDVIRCLNRGWKSADRRHA